MENECSNDQVKNSFDSICVNHVNKTWPVNIITVEFLKESEEDNIDIEKDIVIEVVNNNIQSRIGNRIKFFTQEENNNIVRSDIRISFSPENPNYSEIGTDSLKVSGSSMNLSDLRQEGIIEQFMKALGYNECTMIKYNLDLGRSPCEIDELLKESISYTEKGNTLSRNDVEWLQDTYNKETIPRVIEKDLKKKSILSNPFFIAFILLLVISIVFFIILKYYK
jgi:hypothetical protein